jgi:hypothetical protein
MRPSPLLIGLVATLASNSYLGSALARDAVADAANPIDSFERRSAPGRSVTAPPSERSVAVLDHLYHAGQFEDTARLGKAMIDAWPTDFTRADRAWVALRTGNALTRLSRHSEAEWSYRAGLEQGIPAPFDRGHLEAIRVRGKLLLNLASQANAQAQQWMSEFNALSMPEANQTAIQQPIGEIARQIDTARQRLTTPAQTAAGQRSAPAQIEIVYEQPGKGLGRSLNR